MSTLLVFLLLGLSAQTVYGRHRHHPDRFDDGFDWDGRHHEAYWPGVPIDDGNYDNSYDIWGDLLGGLSRTWGDDLDGYLEEISVYTETYPEHAPGTTVEKTNSTTETTAAPTTSTAGLSTTHDTSTVPPTALPPLPTEKPTTPTAALTALPPLTTTTPTAALTTLTSATTTPNSDPATPTATSAPAPTTPTTPTT